MAGGLPNRFYDRSRWALIDKRLNDTLILSIALCIALITPCYVILRGAAVTRLRLILSEPHLNVIG